MDIFNKLGIPEDIQAYFDLPSAAYSYGTDRELYNDAGHLIPTTAHLYRKRCNVIYETIVSTSVLDAAAYLTLNRHLYPSFDNLQFIAIGNLPFPLQLHWLSKHVATGKITLAFSDDLAGRLCDIKVAAGIKNKVVKVNLLHGTIYLSMNGHRYLFEPERVSLSAFEKISGLRSGCRTRKPKLHNTFLEQLKSYE